MDKVYKKNKFKKERETESGIVALTFGSRDRSSRLDLRCFSARIVISRSDHTNYFSMDI